MRITVRLDDELLCRAKEVAAQTGRTLTVVIEDALRAWLSRRGIGPMPERIRLIRTGVGGLRPGVDLDHTAGLLEVMEFVRDQEKPPAEG